MSEDPTNEEMNLQEFSKETSMPESESDAADDVAGGSDVDHKSASDLEAVFDIPVRIQAILGRTSMEVSNLLSLEAGDVVELDRKVGEAIDIFVNNRLVARGEVVLVDDRLGVTMTEIIKA